METRILEEIGLTPGEIKTYLALLKIGSGSTGPLAKESQVSRSKLYIILDKLEKKGLVSHNEKNGITYFQASEPLKIKDYISEKEKSLSILKKDFEKFLPELETLQEDAGRVQKVKVYQGIKGLITAHEHTYLKLSKGDEYYYLGIPENQPETHHLYWERDHIRRVEKGIKCKMLFNRSTPRAVLKNRKKYKFCDVRYMPTDIKTPAYFLIYKDTTMIAIPSENPLVIEIISQEVSDSFMAYFNEFWKRSKPF
jgi:sugar-specific transcriptional regulator TrmB